MEEGNRSGDGCLKRKALGSVETKAHVVKDPQSLVVVKVQECLPCSVNLVSTALVKLLERANVALERE